MVWTRSVQTARLKATTIVGIPPSEAILATTNQSKTR